MKPTQYIRFLGRAVFGDALKNADSYIRLFESRMDKSKVPTLTAHEERIDAVVGEVFAAYIDETGMTSNTDRVMFAKTTYPTNMGKSFSFLANAYRSTEKRNLSDADLEGIVRDVFAGVALAGATDLLARRFELPTRFEVSGDCGKIKFNWNLLTASFPKLYKRVEAAYLAAENSGDFETKELLPSAARFLAFAGQVLSLNQPDIAPAKDRKVLLDTFAGYGVRFSMAKTEISYEKALHRLALQAEADFD